MKSVVQEVGVLIFLRHCASPGIVQRLLKVQKLREVSGMVGKFVMALHLFAVITLLIINQCFKAKYFPVTDSYSWLTQDFIDTSWRIGLQGSSDTPSEPLLCFCRQWSPYQMPYRWLGTTLQLAGAPRSCSKCAEKSSMPVLWTELSDLQHKRKEELCLS